MKTATIVIVLFAFSIHAYAQNQKDSLKTTVVDSIAFISKLERLSAAFSSVTKSDTSSGAGGLSTPSHTKDADLIRSQQTIVDELLFDGGRNGKKTPSKIDVSNSTVGGGMQMPPSLKSGINQNAVADTNYKQLAEEYGSQLDSLAQTNSCAARYRAMFQPYDSGTWMRKYLFRKLTLNQIKDSCK